MREILFRGKSKGKPEWVYGSLYKEGPQVFILVGGRFYPKPSNGQSALGIVDWYEVFPDSIAQFTGLTDKNGKMIFEGDVCSYYTPEYHDGKHFYKAERETGEVRINTRGVVFGGWQYTTPFGGCVSVIEIIGNIHDNAELLEEKTC